MRTATRVGATRIGPLFAAVVAIVTLVGVPSPAPAATLTNATFVDTSGAHAASFTWSGPCNGTVTVTLTISRATGPDQRVASVKSIMQPDLCNIACLDCPAPFVWVLDGANIALAGGGVVPAGWTLAGKFQEGVLQVRGLISVTAR